MAAPFAKGFSTAVKRARSQDSLKPMESPSANKATKTEEHEEVLELPQFLRQTRADISAKYTDIQWQEQLRLSQGRNNPGSKWVQATDARMALRNRYSNVLPWDNCRVHLKVAEGSLDYINASPISLHDPITGIQTSYIATQGPTKLALDHFWQMIWHETNNVAVIVMLTPTEESGKEKCYQYFPLDASSSPITFKIEGDPDGDPKCEVSFLELSSESGSNTKIRKLCLKVGSETKTVWHMLFTAFPDHGVPEDEDRLELLELIKSSAEKNSAPGNPRTIHCSAGVGRSGTFIALEYLLAQLDSRAVAKAKEGEDMVYEVVTQLREQRMMMVQTDTQYQFLYDVLREEFDRKQAAAYVSGQPSPKLRKLAGGIKAAMLEETELAREHITLDLKEAETNDSRKEDSRKEDSRKEDEGQPPHAR